MFEMRWAISLLFLLALASSVSPRATSKEVKKSRALQDSGAQPETPEVAKKNATSTAKNASSDDDDDEDGELKCNSKLLKAFGFSGQTRPAQVSLEMCPSVLHSCCTAADQQIFVKNWVTNKEGENLKLKMERDVTELNKYFEQAAKVNKLAHNLLTLKAGSTPNECSLLARRILSFQIEESSVTINAALQKSYFFLEKSHEGIYCSMCDAKKGEFFTVEQNKIVISERFCRDLMVSSLPGALYVNSHLPKYMSLVALFMGNCNNLGDFKKGQMPDGVIAQVEAATENMLKGCFENRNTEGWATACVPVCEQFQIGVLANVFRPNLKHLMANTKFLTEALKTWETAGTAATGDATKPADGAAGTPAAGTPPAAGAAPAAEQKPASSRILKSKFVPKRKQNYRRLNRHYDHPERRLPRRLQNAEETKTPATTSETPAAGGTATQNPPAGGTEWKDGKSSTIEAKANADAAAAAKNATEAADPYAPLIYNSFDKNSGINLEGVTSAVKVTGVHFFEYGLVSDFTAQKAKSLRALLKVRKLTQIKKGSRKLNSEAALSAVLVALLAWFIRT